MKSNILVINRNDFYLYPLVVLFLLLVAGVSFHYDRRLPPPVWEGRDFIQVNPQQISKIVLKDKNKSLTLMKEGQGFSIGELDQAPASLLKVNEILLKISGIKIAQEIGSKKDWEQWHVTDDKADFQMTLVDSTGQERSFLVGKSNHRGQRALRFKNRDEVFISEESLWFNVSHDDYLETKPIRLDAAQLNQVELYEQEKKIALDDSKKSDIKNWFTQLQVKKYFRTGTKAQELHEINWRYKAEVKDQQGIMTHVMVGQKEQQFFVRAQAWLPQAESEENTGPIQILDLKQLGLKSSVDRLNQKYLPWVYELNQTSVDQFKKIVNIDK